MVIDYIVILERNRACVIVFFFFFFQAEDGIRDVAVTGVQTCALPIFALDEGLDRALDEDLGEPADLPPGLVASLLVGALDGGLEHDAAAARDEPAQPGELARLEITLVLVLPVRDVQELFSLAAVQYLDSFPQAPQAVGEPGGQGGFPGATHSGEPHREASRCRAVHGSRSPQQNTELETHITGCPTTTQAN